jgi:KDO2-lipid IV(A) lauroyltransferase
MGVMDSIFCWWASASRVEHLVEFEGLEHLDQARTQGAGVLLLAGHFSTLELSVRLLRMKTEVRAFAANRRNPVVDHVTRERREFQLRTPLIPKDNVRELVRTLRGGGIVWYSPDQVARSGSGAVVPFFGQPAMTNLTTGRVARMGRAAVVPTQTLRLPKGRGYRVLLFPQLGGFPSDNDEADAQRMNQVIESMIRRAPEQYLWLHRRFKRARGWQVDVYARAT